MTGPSGKVRSAQAMRTTRTSPSVFGLLVTPEVFTVDVAVVETHCQTTKSYVNETTFPDATSDMLVRQMFFTLTAVNHSAPSLVGYSVSWEYFCSSWCRSRPHLRTLSWLTKRLLRRSCHNPVVSDATTPGWRFLCGGCGVQMLRNDERLAITRMALPVPFQVVDNLCALHSLSFSLQQPCPVQFPPVLARLVP